MSDRPGLPLARLAAEFAVIVIGVLVALFTESAWQERGNRIEEAEVLERIAEEVQDDEGRLTVAGLWLDFAIPAAERVPDILAGRDTLPPHAQLALLYAAATVNRVDYLFWTWDELRETGRTSLIRDRDLRSQLLLYFGASAAFEQRRADLPDTYRAVVTGLLPAEYTNRVLNQCLRSEADPGARPADNALRALESCSEMPRSDARALLAAIRDVEGLAIEAGRLAYELGQVRETLSTLLDAHPETVAALELRAIG